MSWFRNAIANLYAAVLAPIYNSVIRCAAEKGHIEIVKLCKEWEAADFDEAIQPAACKGRIEIVKLCKEWGATNFDVAMRFAAYGGHIEIVKLCKEWGQRALTRLSSGQPVEATLRSSSYAKSGGNRL